jgi:hypothetical protein
MPGWLSRIFPAQPAEPARAPEPQAAPLAREPGENRTEFSVPVTYMRSDVPEVDSAYGYGHLDGRRGVDADNFREFIEHTVAREEIEFLLADLEARERFARERAATLRGQRAELAARAEELRAATAKNDQAGKAASDAEAGVRAAKAYHEENRQKGSRAQAFVFLLAAALFIFGDVVMSQKVVADALGLKGTRIFNVIDESWVFAAGLAMISIVLKPAYDRLVEKPYWEGKERRFVVTICTLALASFITLWVLGDFRFESHGQQTRITRLDDTAAAQANGSLNKIEEEMLSSRLGRFSFIFSGLLFAAAGAVSLSIGMRYAREYRHLRHPAIKDLAEQKRILEEAVATRDRTAGELTSRSAEIERLKATIAGDPEAPELEAQADLLARERRAMMARRVNVRTLGLPSLYDDGYALGTVLAHEAAEEAARVPAPDERPKRRRPRPFVALRRAIREVALTPTSMN